MILLIDDLRSFKPGHLEPGTVTCRTSAEGIRALENAMRDDVIIRELWLDHDLGGDDTIRPVVDWIEAHKPDIRKVYIHTSNPVGRDHIRRVLWNYDCGVMDAGTFFTAEYVDAV